MGEHKHCIGKTKLAHISAFEYRQRPLFHAHTHRYSFLANEYVRDAFYRDSIPPDTSLAMHLKEELN